MILIDNFAIPEPFKTDNAEENLAFFGPRALDDFYSYQHVKLWGKYSFKSQMEQMMFVLPYLAKFFGIDKDDLLQRWTSDYGMHHMMKDKE